MRPRDCLLAVAILLFASGVAFASAAPRLSADAAVLMEWSTGTLLYGKNAHQPRHPASLTKLVTALVAVDCSLPDDIVVVSPKAARVEGSSAHLKPLHRYTMEDLLYGLLVSSGNDAALAIAEHIGGSVAEFAALMTEKARSYGALNSRFLNPHGLTAQGHYTSAHDVAVFLIHALDHPLLARIMATKTVRIEDVESGEGPRLRNTNKLLWTYMGSEGGKTGTTSAAGKCLAAAATRDGTTLVAVVMHSSARWEDTATLLDWGFDHYRTVRAVTAGQMVKTIPVKGGVSPRVTLVAESDLNLVVRQQDVARIEYRECEMDEVRAPVRAGQPCGWVEAYLDDELLGRAVLVSSADIPRKTLWTEIVRLVERLRALFTRRSDS